MKTFEVFIGTRKIIVNGRKFKFVDGSLQIYGNGEELVFGCPKDKLNYIIESDNGKIESADPLVVL